MSIPNPSTTGEAEEFICFICGEVCPLEEQSDTDIRGRNNFICKNCESERILGLEK